MQMPLPKRRKVRTLNMIDVSRIVCALDRSVGRRATTPYRRVAEGARVARKQQEARPRLATGLITRQARLPFDDDQKLRRRPELVDVLDPQIATEARSIALQCFGVVETLPG